MNNTEVLEIRPIYRERLRKALDSSAHCSSENGSGSNGSSSHVSGSHCGTLASEPGCEIVSATEEGVTLSALVDKTSSVVRKAVYGGQPGLVTRGLMEVLCEIMENKPMQECSDHAALRLEFSLRDPTAPRPVSGIVQPENADPAFALPRRLVRKLAAAFGEKTGYVAAANRFVLPSPAAWQKLSDAERADALQAMIDGHPAGAGVHVNQVETAHRAVVSFDVELDSAGKYGRLAQLETWLKEEIDNSFQLLQEAKRDQNTLRKKGPGK